MPRVFAVLLACAVLSASLPGAGLEDGFRSPPRESGVRCWWWWLNSNVTEEAITRDLTEMKAKGFSGAMIFDAGGAEQRGNAQVPAGPLYASPEWRKLYRHALKEADRLGLTLGLSIQSGWNLGGPNVTADFAAKQLTWAEIQIKGPTALNRNLPVGPARSGYYRDVAVLAYKNKDRNSAKVRFAIKAGSSQSGFPVTNVLDSSDATFWVSGGDEPGQGPTPERPESITITFAEETQLARLSIQGRKGYGPAGVRVICKETNEATQRFSIKDGQNAQLQFSPITGKTFDLVFDQAYDPRFPDTPRNVQVAAIVLADSAGQTLTPAGTPPIENLQLKAGTRELGGSAPDCRFLLNDRPASPGEEDVLAENVIDISAKMAADGTLSWDVPEGTWTVLRFGYTITNAHVSTYSGDWKGLVVDYLSRDAFDRYWHEVVVPLIEDAGPLAGRVLKQLETDSWECGGMNWSPNLAADFRKYRAYDLTPYLPVFAGKIVDNRQASNAFLADFRKTLGDCVADNHYAVFAERAHAHNLEIQPESGGPHAGPLDAIKNLGKSDIVMGEFWVPSPHRPNPVNRFYMKQASSAAHIYGKKYVAAEAFTSIGPHWDDVLWKSQKPSMDHEFCSGLNMIYFHTFTCSPKEMGIPGQEYFAGTHVNPQVTWWEYAGAFIDYINRCHFMTQPGKFVADVLYYYGDHVPNVARLKEDDPARVLPGYDYDITDEVILQRLKVVDNRIVVPGGIAYRLLVLPDHQVLSLAALEKVNELLGRGATVLGPKPDRLVSLVGGDAAQRRFKQLADQLWADPAQQGQRNVGRGLLIWGRTGRQALADLGCAPDFTATAQPGAVDYIHYTIDDADVYFVANQSADPIAVSCSFRITGRQPELWDPLTGRIRNALAFSQKDARTDVPVHFDPYGSTFVVFRKAISPNLQGTKQKNAPDLSIVQEISGPWDVGFDPQWGGPEHIVFDQLKSWTDSPNAGVRYYSGKAVYKNTFAFAGAKHATRYLLELGEVKDVGISSVCLNGRDVGVTWTPPFRVDITEALRHGANELTISVVNSWRNRLFGDRDLPQSQRYTRTNITIRKEWPLLNSGLLGPVRVLEESVPFRLLD